MKKFKKIIRICISVLLFFIILFSGYQLIEINSDYRKSDLLYEKTQVTFSKVTDTRDDESDGLDDEVDDSPVDITVDFEELQKINSDIVGWIYFENEDISYPLLYSGDDKKYLRTSYTGEHMTAGSIFISGSNNPDFMDRHTIIYGHNMKNLSMFGKLKFYRQKKDYYNDHKYFQIITPYESYRYEILGYMEVKPSSKVYRTNFASDEEFNEFILDNLMVDSLDIVDIELPDESKVVTLSTCSDGDKRFIVSALQIE